MLQYVYLPSDIGLTRWPEGELRLEGIEKTENPEEADIFVCPGALHKFERAEELDRFPYMKGNEARHAFFHCGDHEVLYSKPCIFVRCNTRQWYFDKDPATVAWPWPVADFASCVEVPETGFKQDVTFRGWIHSDSRRKSAESCRDSGLSADIVMYSNFTGYIGTPSRPEYDPVKFDSMMSTFKQSMKESRVCLCPEQIPSVFPYRFWESLSAGRVPLLVGSDFVFPFADRIPYSEFCIFVERDQAEDAGRILRNFIAQTSDETIIEMGLKARHYFETWLHRDSWPRLMAIAVSERVAALQCV